MTFKKLRPWKEVGEEEEWHPPASPSRPPTDEDNAEKANNTNTNSTPARRGHQQRGMPTKYNARDAYPTFMNPFGPLHTSPPIRTVGLVPNNMMLPSPRGQSLRSSSSLSSGSNNSYSTASRSTTPGRNGKGRPAAVFGRTEMFLFGKYVGLIGVLCAVVMMSDDNRDE